MTVITAFGVAGDQLGLSTHIGYGLDERGAAHCRTRHVATPASAYRLGVEQLAVDWEHGDQVLGKCVHLERRSGSLVAVAEIDVERCDGVDLTGQPVYFSPQSWDTGRRGSARVDDAELLGLALTSSPATNALPPVQLLAGDVERVASRATGPVVPLLQRAVEARRSRRLSIVDLDERERPEVRHASHDPDVRPPGCGPVEYRGGGYILAVR